MQMPIPDLITLASELGFSEFELSRYVLRSDRFYTETHRSPDAGLPQRAPSPVLAKIQQWIAARILCNVPVSEACKCWRRGTTTAANESWPHKKRRFIYTTELGNYLEAITFKRVLAVFLGLAYPEPVAHALARLCTYRGKLCLDACTSAILANIVCRKLDRRLTQLSARQNWTYTRCGAEITISGNTSFADAELVEKMIILEEFSINPLKTRLYTRSNKQVTTGKPSHRSGNARSKKRSKVASSWERAMHTGTDSE